MSTAGFEPITSGFKSQNAATELPRLTTKTTKHYLSYQYTYNTVLAIFSQLPPLCATQDLYEAKHNHFPHLLNLYNFLVVSCSLFENISFWLYFCKTCINLNFYLWQINTFFCYIFGIHLDFLYFSPNSRKKIFIGEIWDLGKIPTSILIVSYR